MPRTFTPAQRLHLAEITFRRLSDGELLKHITADPDWPNRRTLNDWARADPTIAGLLACGRYNRRLRPFCPYDPAVAERLLQRIRLGMPVGELVREPGYPTIHGLRGWRATQPEFAARYRAAVAAAYRAFHRHARTRRAWRPYDGSTADAILLAVMRGAVLATLLRDRSLPSPKGLQRWRRLRPDFDGALRNALLTGLRARRRAAREARCTPGITRRVEGAIIEGASLNSLAQRPDMPSGYTLYRWVQDQPAFAAAVASASEFRDDWLYRDRIDHLAARADPAAVPEINALNKRLGQLNPHPGAKRRPR